MRSALVFVYLLCLRSPVPAMWGEWGAWETCPVTCGGGIQERMRDCVQDADCPDNMPCDESIDDDTDDQDCNTDCCEGARINLYVAIRLCAKLLNDV